MGLGILHTSLFAASLASLTLIHAWSAQDPRATEVYVEGNRAPGVVYEGKAFDRVRTWIEGQGVGRVAFAGDQVLDGDFRIDARLTLVRREATAAALQLGSSFFGFDGKGDTLFLNGPTFGGGVTILGSADGFIRDGRPFDFVAERRGSSLRFTIDGELAHEHEVGTRALGRFGFRPHRATLRIHRFSASGAIGAPPARDPPELQVLQPAIDAAIDDGVEYLLRNQHRDGSWGGQAVKFFGGMTALCTYTLLQCGLSPDHPAMRQALVYLRQVVPHETYSVAFTLLALEATGDPQHVPWMEELTEALIEWEADGSWGYPFLYSKDWRRDIGRSDLSNAQLAALGLRAAEKAGIEVPRKVWLRMIDGTLRYRCAEERIGTAADVGTTRETKIAGFGYKGPLAPYGSMTAAGVAILEIGRQALGDELEGETARHTDRAIRAGVAWLAHYFSVDENPGSNKWLYYYLYGLERIGALLGVERIGEHPWYLEGAESLLERREQGGSWVQKEREADTCFALLFLERATAPSSGPRAVRGAVRELQEPHHEVHLRATGENPLTVWITGFGDTAHQEFAYGQGGPRVLAVEYLRDGELIARVEGDPRRGWSGERYAGRIDFSRRGDYRVDVRVLVVSPHEAQDMIGEPEVLEAEGFEVEIEHAWEEGMQQAAALRGENLLRGRGVSAKASSLWADAWAAELAFDGLESTAWLCASDDTAPTLELHLGRGLRADALVLGSVGSSAVRAQEFDRILSVDVVLDDKHRHRIEFDPDPRRAARLDFARRTRVKTIRIENIEREPGAKYSGGCGFSEVALIATH